MTGTALAAGSLALAAGAGAAPRYQPANLFGTGYSDRQVGPGVWDVRGASATPEGGHAIALYRAAELARAAGASELRIVRQHIVTTSRTDRRGTPMMFVREVASLRVRAIRSADDRAACEEKDPRHCVTVPIDRLMAQFGPLLERDSGTGAMPSPPVVRVGLALPAGATRWQAPPASARPPVATTAAYLPAPGTTTVPARPLSPYELGRQQARAALAASGERVDD